MAKVKKGKKIPSLDEIHAARNEFEAQNQNNERLNNRRPTYQHEGWLRVDKYDYSHNGNKFTGKHRATKY